MNRIVFSVILRLKFADPIRESVNEKQKRLSRRGQVPMKNKNGRPDVGKGQMKNKNGCPDVEGGLLKSKHSFPMRDKWFEN